MNIRDCWRLTDNRHWDSPGRMSDGRIFTDWRSACTRNNAIAEKAGISKGLSHSYSDMLQQMNGSRMCRQISEARAVTGDPWGRAYTPPPPKQVIVPVSRQGVELLVQDVPGAIGATVNSGKSDVQYNGRPSQGGSRVSDCGTPAMPRCDSRWGLSSETLVLNLRDASAGGGSTTGWLRGTLDGDRV